MQKKDDKDSGNLEGTKNKWLNVMEEGQCKFRGSHRWSDRPCISYDISRGIKVVTG